MIELLKVVMVVCGLVLLVFLFACIGPGRKRVWNHLHRFINDNNAIIFPIWIFVLVSAFFSLNHMIKGTKHDTMIVPKTTMLSTDLDRAVDNVVNERMPPLLSRESQLAWNKDGCVQQFAQMPTLKDSSPNECAAKALARQTEKPPLQEPTDHWVVGFFLFLLKWRTSTLIVIAIFCTLYVLRDEVGRAGTVTMDNITKRKGSGQNLPDIQGTAPQNSGSLSPGTPVPPVVSTSALGRFGEYFTAAFVVEFLEQIYKHWFRSRRGGL